MYASAEGVPLHAGAIMHKPLDSSKKWESLDRDAKHTLESLLHDLPDRQLTAAQLLHNLWLYAAQGKLFPNESVFTYQPSPLCPPPPPPPTFPTTVSGATHSW